MDNSQVTDVSITDTKVQDSSAQNESQNKTESSNEVPVSQLSQSVEHKDTTAQEQVLPQTGVMDNTPAYMLTGSSFLLLVAVTIKYIFNQVLD